MSPKTEEQILKKLERIEGLLIQIIPQRTELTEEDVLKIVEEGRQEYKEGKLEDFDDFIKREYPQYAKKSKGKAVQSI
jgi:hypothetical protein